MRLVFAGTPDFAAAALHALLAAGHDIPLVLTQPDRPAGRGMKLQASPVKQLALERGIALSQPRSLRLDGKYPDDALQARDALRAVEPAAIVVAAYGLLLPRWVLDSTVGEPPLGCLNIHASLLPRWRGAAPIQRAIEAGDARTGVTIMRMDEGLDTGGMLSVESLEIGADETTATLHDRLAVLGARLMVETIERVSRAPLEARAQPTEGVTYASKIEKREAAIDWTHPATELERRIRAFDPFPGATFAWRGEVLKCWAAEAVVTEAAEPPGTVVGMDDGRPLVRCGAGALRLTLLQRPGGKRLPAQEALRGRAPQAGEALLMAG